MRDDWMDGAAAATTVESVRGYLRGEVRGRPDEGTLAGEIDAHKRHAVVWAIINTCLVAAGVLLLVVALIRPASAQTIPSSATGVYLTQSDAPWTCAHEFGQLDNGKRYWRPACIRTPGMIPYAAHYIVWQWPADCPQVGAEVPMWAPGDLSWPPDYMLRIDAYAPGALALTVRPFDGPPEQPQIISTQVIHLQPQIPYTGCGAGGAHLDGKGR